MPIKIITDSTSDLPLDLAESLGVTIVPANVIFGQEQFKDRVEMTPAQFYERLVDSPVHPTTSAPSIGQFVEAYESVAPDADGIVSIHVSAKLSATYNAAVQASEQVSLDCPDRGHRLGAGHLRSGTAGNRRGHIRCRRGRLRYRRRGRAFGE